MGKMKIGIIADILTQVFRHIKILLTGPLPNIYFLSKTLNLIGCHGNQKAKFAKQIFKKSIPQKLHIGDKAETLQKCS